MRVLPFDEWYQQQLLQYESLCSALEGASPAEFVMIGEEIALARAGLRSPKLAYYFYTTLMAQRAAQRRVQGGE